MCYLSLNGILDQNQLVLDAPHTAPNNGRQGQVWIDILSVVCVELQCQCTRGIAKAK
jgi:hypothetical protein